MHSGRAGRETCSALRRKTSLKTSGVFIHLSPQTPDRDWPGLSGEYGGLACSSQRASGSQGCLAMSSRWTQPLTIWAPSEAGLSSSCSLRRQPWGTAACRLWSDVGLTWVGSAARDSCLSLPRPPPAGADPCVCPGPRSGAVHPAGDLLVGAARLGSGNPGLSGHLWDACVQPGRVLSLALGRTQPVSLAAIRSGCLIPVGVPAQARRPVLCFPTPGTPTEPCALGPLHQNQRFIEGSGPRWGIRDLFFARHDPGCRCEG